MYGWPYTDMIDGDLRADEDITAGEQAEREAREDRAADYAPAGIVPFVRLNAEPLRVHADYVRDVIG